MRWGWGWGGVLVALGLLVAGAAQDATTDTVVTASAGTAHLGVGYRFPDDGWMGTYVVGNRPTFCIDLNGRGPSTAGGYVVAPATSLKKQVGWSPDHRGGTADALTGPALTAQELGRLAYLTDRYAATTSPETAAAAEHVVRLLTVGDAAQSRREKVRWAQTLAAHPKVKRAFDAMAKDVAEHAGPYTLTATWVTKPSATAPGSLRITLLSAASAGMPAVALTGSVTGDARPITARTDRRGTATIAVTARARGQLDVAVTARGLAAAVPLLYTPENYADRGSPDHAAQRTVGAAPRASLSATASTTITGLTPKLATTAAPRAPAVGDDLTDAVAVTGALPGWTGTVTARLWGPFPVKPKPADCADPAIPAGETAVDVPTDAKGSGTATTPPVTAAAPGWYTWTETLPGTPLQDDAVAACAAPSETFLVNATPMLALAPDGAPRPGDPADVDVTLTGSLPGITAKVALVLYGPFASAPAATDCTPKAKIAATAVTFTGDDTLTSPVVKPGGVGYYTWTAAMPGSTGQSAAAVPCGDPSATFAVTRPDLGALNITNTSTAGAVTPHARPPATGATLTVGAADRGASLKAPLVPMSLLGPGVGTPDSIALAGQLDVGAHVGDLWGTILVAGRVGDAQGVPGALFPLQRVAPGDTITLTDTNRRTQRFTVDTVSTQSRALPLPPDLFAQGQSPLRLVVLTATDATSYGAGLVTHVSHWIVTASPS